MTRGGPERRPLGGLVLPSAFGTLALYGALLLARDQLVRELGIPYAKALSLGLPIGWLYDASIALAPCVVAGLFWAAIRVPYLATWLAVALLVWATTFANVLYFRFFGTPLEGWVVKYHLADLFAIRDQIAPLALTGPLLASVGIVGAGTSSLLLRRWRRRVPRPDRAGTRHRMRMAMGSCLLAVVSAGFAFAAWALEPWHYRGGSILAEQVVVAVLKQRIVGSRRPAARGTSDHLRKVVSGVETGAATHAGEVLQQYRDWLPSSEAVPARPRPAGAAVPEAAERGWPLERTLSDDADLAPTLRAELGLPPDSRPNVVVLLLESVRALELLDPEIGPAIFPRMRAVLARHGMFFTSAYSSAPFDAGRTVNGKFSTLCSMLPEFGGPAAYVARPGLRVRCLQEVAGENGYQTVSLFGGRPQFHNKYLFESMHGMERFVDYDFFKTIPYEQTFPACDYPDQPFLRASVPVLEELGAAGRPLFASMLTLSTHPPYYVIPGGEIPEQLARRIGNSEYEGYLSRLRYLDESLGEFFASLFAGPLGDTTVVFLLGDHGLRLRTVTLSERRTVELTARVPLAIVTKHMRAPSVRTEPVHQIDVAPTVAAIAGLTGKVTWLGRNLLRGTGSPWVVGGSGPLHYRVGNRACYSMTGEDRPRCYELGKDQDPLLDDDLQNAPWRADEVKFMEDVVESARLAIALNLIAPPRERDGRGNHH